MVKGFEKTLEAAIAIVLILVSIIFLFTNKEITEPQLSATGYECLKNLDNQGMLRYYAANGLEDRLNADLKTCIPSLLNYTTKICATSTCNTVLPINKTVFLSTYLIAGDNSFNPRLVDLWVWLK
jgi:hypothetical protein